MRFMHVIDEIHNGFGLFRANYLNVEFHIANFTSAPIQNAYIALHSMIVSIDKSIFLINSTKNSVF